VTGWILLALAILITGFGVAGFTGAPYVPVLKRDHEALLKLADLKPGQTLIDLGAGDGYLLRAAARRGIRGIGYEINPVMVIVAKILCFRHRKLVQVHLADFWHLATPPGDAIYVFLIPRLMSKLDHKLAAEIKRPTKVISYAFEIPGKQPKLATANAFLYEYGSHPN
jgi:hypothetical protein